VRPSPFIDIISQHAEEAAFLWHLRSQAVHAPNYTLADLAELDHRIEAHLEGLKVAGDTGWDLCVQALEGGDAGAVFAASILALDNGGPDRLETVLQAVEAAPETGRGAIAALGWRGFPGTQPVAKSLLASETPARKRIGIGAFAIHRMDPGTALDDALSHPDPLLRARALKAAGELGAAGRLKAVEAHLEDKDAACAFWAAWSATLLGSAAGLKQLGAIAESDSPHGERALRLVARHLSPAVAQPWITRLASNKATVRLAIIAAGASGLPDRIPWLIEWMNHPECARAAGESFSLITGLDLAAAHLDGDEPEGFQSGPTDNPEDEDVAMDADGDLPWPRASDLAQWWVRHEAAFVRGTRYLNGKPAQANGPLAGDPSASQRLRFAAVLESAGNRPGYFSVETRAKSAPRRSNP
jgi:uncharacterized protein (TIGR02270 family)